MAGLKAFASRSSGQVQAAYQSDVEKIREVLQELLAGAYKLRMRGCFVFVGLLCSVTANILSVLR